jgi:hypothetical protein
VEVEEEEEEEEEEESVHVSMMNRNEGYRERSPRNPYMWEA